MGIYDPVTCGSQVGFTVSFLQEKIKRRRIEKESKRINKFNIKT